MPLRAEIEGKSIISTDISDEMWEELRIAVKQKRKTIQLPCCQQEGFLRKSSLGLKHFVHKTNKQTCNYKSESVQHLYTKLQILKACRDYGWEATPEYIGDGWIADVFAVKGNHRIAFEVQWSRQSLEETNIRQTKYKDNGIRACWFFKYIPKNFQDYNYYPKADRDLPLFKISEKDNKMFVEFYGKDFELSSFISKLLSSKIKYCKTYKVQNTKSFSIVFYDYQCWKCKSKQHIYYVERELFSKCNHPIDEFHLGHMWGGDSLEFHPKVLQKISNILNSSEGKNIVLGDIKKRYSKMANSSYVSFGCKYCDALFGDFYLQQEKHDGNIAFIFTVNIDGISEIAIDSEHWCISDIGDFCE